MKFIKYGASFCGPCRMMEKTLKESGLPYESIDMEGNEDLFANKNIKSIPTIELVEEDKVLFRNVGPMSMDALKKAWSDNL